MKPLDKKIWGPEKPVILLATKNAHKIQELRAALRGRLEAIGLAQWESSHRRLPAPEETETTFYGNALLKAAYYAQASGQAVLADDSGLMVEALGGRPGVKSSRYGGPHLSDHERNQLLLAEMKGQANRRAKFVCQLVLAAPQASVLAWAGELEGLIALKPAGQNGFGYDPIFFHPPSGRTLGQLSPAEKNNLSHRGRAIEAMLSGLKTSRQDIVF